MRGVHLCLVLVSVCGDPIVDPETAWIERWREPSGLGWQSLAGSIDVSCTFQFRLGMSATGPSSVSPTLELTFAGAEGERASFSSKPHASESSYFTAVPRLCQYAGNGTRLPEGPADLMVTSTAGYLFRQWPYFANHVLFASNGGHRVFIWIGELPSKLATTVEASCMASKQGQVLMDEGMNPPPHERSLKSVYYGRDDGPPALNSNHYNKIPASAAILDHPGVTGLFYADLDSYYDRSALRDPRVADAMHFDAKYDVGFYVPSGRSPFWNVKGCAYYMRDSTLANAVLDGWITDRCGFKDQYPLWHTILHEAAKERCLVYDGEIYAMLSYDAMKRGTKRFPNLDVAIDDLPKVCPTFRFHPTRFERPIHRSVNETEVAIFPYRDSAGVARELRVSNLLYGTPWQDDLLDHIGLAALDPAHFH